MFTHPAINVEIFNIAGLSIRWYSIMYILGFLIYSWWMQKEFNANRLILAKNKKINDSSIILNDMVFYAMLGVILGGRIGYAILYNAKYYFLEDPLAILRPWEGGMSFHGAFIGVYIAYVYTLKKHQKSNLSRSYTLLDISDVTLVTVPLGLGLGRLGNFINGELYGRPTASIFGMIFPKRPELGHFGAQLLPIEQVQNIIDKANIALVDNVNSFMINGQQYIQIPRHPSQLYQALMEGFLTFAIMAFLYYKSPLSKYRGFLTGVFWISYGSSRVIAEFFRQPDAQIGYLVGNWLTAGMLYSIPMILVGIYFIHYSLSKKQLNLTRGNA